MLICIQYTVLLKLSVMLLDRSQLIINQRSQSSKILDYQIWGLIYKTCVRTDLIVKREKCKLHSNVRIYKKALSATSGYEQTYALLLVQMLQVFGNS